MKMGMKKNKSSWLCYNVSVIVAEGKVIVLFGRAVARIPTTGRMSAGQKKNGEGFLTFCVIFDSLLSQPLFQLDALYVLVTFS